ncbi:23S rRNA (adenine(2503)-C(2))-methyltransferase RlmN [Oligoflexia bacterium]|nr:23S rRNA (adenine(2503)-C(2))-methyltransferase RlmN [Oligoflexia bacterium]
MKSVANLHGLSDAPVPEGQGIDFFSLTRQELAKTLQASHGLSSYRADQLFQWVYQKFEHDLSNMTNIKKELREELEAVFHFPNFKHKACVISADGSRKYLFKFGDGDKVEAVMIKQPTRMTLCVSSQVGCALGCRFCRTGTMGLKRNLTASEIIRQVLGVMKDSEQHADSFHNIVFMGMGEPLQNADNLIAAIGILNDDFGLGVAARKITVSTAGLVPEIKRFAESGVDANLAISLNATTDEIRSSIMPINKRYPLARLLKTLREMPLKPRKRVTIEYVMLSGVNDSNQDLNRIPKLLHGIPAKINLIPYNDNAGLGFVSPPENRFHYWQQELMKRGFVTTIRWSKGDDISAACGQLATDLAAST